MKRCLGVAALFIWYSLSLNAVETKPEDSIKNNVQTVPDMTNQKLKEILEKEGEIVEGEMGYWQVNYKERLILVITDEVHNRMRIISPIAETKELEQKYYREMLEAQFDRALDVKYAINKDIVWSVFAHPLRELTEEQVVDALSQVYYAAQNFGGSYVSTDLIFGGGDDH